VLHTAFWPVDSSGRRSGFARIVRHRVFDACFTRQANPLPPLYIDYLVGVNILMVKAMKYRDLASALTRNGCRSRPGKGDHEKWFCPCGKHIAVVTKPGEVSPGVVADTMKKLTCLPKGWLQ
jgi:hypothetical protein